MGSRGTKIWELGFFGEKIDKDYFMVWFGNWDSLGNSNNRLRCLYGVGIGLSANFLMVWEEIVDTVHLGKN